jgi:hypothetical protein
LFLLVASRDLRPFWHGFAVAVHVLLGLANIVFFSSFVSFGLAPMGVAATVVHGIFVVAHAVVLARPERQVAPAPQPR